MIIQRLKASKVCEDLVIRLRSIVLVRNERGTGFDNDSISFSFSSSSSFASRRRMMMISGTYRVYDYVIGDMGERGFAGRALCAADYRNLTLLRTVTFTAWLKGFARS